MPEIFDSKKQKASTARKKTGDKSPKLKKALEAAKKRKEAKSKKQVKLNHKPKHVNEYSATLRREKPEKNPLKAYAPKPLRVFFDSQLQEEQVVLMLRRHPITQWKKIVISIVMIFLPILFSKIPLIDILPINYLVASLIGWYLLILGFIFESFLLWFFNVYIITDERIIDVDFISVIYKNVSSAKIENIEDITATSSGVLSSIVDFGTILIQTAGEQNEIEFEDVPHPAKVTRILNELMIEEEKEKIEGRVR